jgi:hypothetical protein
MIKQISGQANDLSDLDSRWREFDARLAAFNDKIEENRTKLR